MINSDNSTSYRFVRDYWTRSFEGLILYNIGSSCVVQVKETEAQRVEVAYLSKAMLVPKKASLGLKQRLMGSICLQPLVITIPLLDFPTLLVSHSFSTAIRSPFLGGCCFILYSLSTTEVPGSFLVLKLIVSRLFSLQVAAVAAEMINQGTGQTGNRFPLEWVVPASQPLGLGY